MQPIDKISFKSKNEVFFFLPKGFHQDPILVGFVGSLNPDLTGMPGIEYPKELASRHGSKLQFPVEPTLQKLMNDLDLNNARCYGKAGKVALEDNMLRIQADQG